MKQRNATIDVLRGFAIILVVIGHAGVLQNVRDVIYFFHMPLFFFISGLFFRPIDKWIYIFIGGGKKLRWKKLYVPFVTNMLLLLTLSHILSEYQITNTTIESFDDWLKNALVILRFRVGCVDLLGQYWFLPVMFFVNFVSLCVTWTTRNKVLLSFLCIVLFLSGYYMSVNIKLNNPYDFSRIMYYSAFYIMGYMGKDYILNADNGNTKDFHMVTCAIVGTLILAFASIFANCVFNNGLLYFMTACIGIAASLCIVFILCKTFIAKTMAYIGKHTMAIFTYHILVFKFVEFIMSLFDIQSMSSGWYGAYPVNPYWYLYSILGVSVPLSIVWLYEMTKNTKKHDNKNQTINRSHKIILKTM